MNSTIQSISPLWEAMPLQRAVQPAAAEKPAVGSLFDVAKKEYLLSTGQLDNPAELSIATYKAEAALALLNQVREKALNAYSELNRISL